MQVRGDTSRIRALGGSFILYDKRTLGLFKVEYEGGRDDWLVFENLHRTKD